MVTLTCWLDKTIKMEEIPVTLTLWLPGYQDEKDLTSDVLPVSCLVAFPAVAKQQASGQC